MLEGEVSALRKERQSLVERETLKMEEVRSLGNELETQLVRSKHQQDDFNLERSQLLESAERLEAANKGLQCQV